jgi:hypothetical protein
MLSSDLRDAIISFVEDRSTVTQLEEWLVPRLPVYLQSPETDDADVVAAVELALADMAAGTRTVQDIRSDLNAVVQPLAALARPERNRTVTSAANLTVQRTIGAVDQSINHRMQANWA